MNRNLSIVALISIIGLPLLLLFQNCGKQDFAQLGLDQSSTKSIPLGEDVPVSTQEGQSTQVEDDDTDKDAVAAKLECEVAEAEDRCEVEEAKNCKQRCEPGEDRHDCDVEIARQKDEVKYRCKSHSNSLESNNARVISAETKSVVGLRGKHVLTKEDFGGNTLIEKIENSFGKLTLCGLTVKSLSRSGGRLILMGNSKIQNIISFHGQIVTVDKDGAIIKDPNK